jgi:hypothetical protein
MGINPPLFELVDLGSGGLMENSISMGMNPRLFEKIGLESGGRMGKKHQDGDRHAYLGEGEIGIRFSISIAE